MLAYIDEVKRCIETKINLELRETPMVEVDTCFCDSIYVGLKDEYKGLIAFDETLKDYEVELKFSNFDMELKIGGKVILSSLGDNGYVNCDICELIKAIDKAVKKGVYMHNRAKEIRNRINRGF